MTHVGPWKYLQPSMAAFGKGQLRPMETIAGTMPAAFAGKWFTALHTIEKRRRG